MDKWYLQLLTSCISKRFSIRNQEKIIIRELHVPVAEGIAVINKSKIKTVSSTMCISSVGGNLECLRIQDSE